MCDIIANILLGIIFFIICIYPTVVIHELSHYTVARVLKVKVDELEIGGGKKELIRHKLFNTDFIFSIGGSRGGRIKISEYEVIKNIKKMPYICISAPLVNLGLGIVLLFLSDVYFLQVFGANNLLAGVTTLFTDGLMAWSYWKKRAEVYGKNHW